METTLLRSALKLVQPCILKVELLPIHAHYCFEPKRLWAYDEVSAIIVGLETGLHCGLHAETLLRLVDLAAAECTLAPDKKGKVLLTSGSTKVELPCLPPEHFTFEDPRTSGKDAMRFKLTEEAIGALEACSISVGTDPRIKVQTAVALRTGSDTAFYATDGVSLARCSMTKALGKETRVALIPQSVCDQIRLITGALECKPEEVEITLSKSYVRADFSDDPPIYLIGKLLQEIPDLELYDKHLNSATGSASVLTVDDEFALSVEKVSAVLAADVHRRCRLQVTKGKLEVSGNGDKGNVVTTLNGTGAKKDALAEVDPDRLIRHRKLVRCLSINADRIAMYDNPKPDKAGFSYVIACYGLGNTQSE